MDINNSATLFTLLVFVITCVIFIFYRKARTSRRGILITGLCESGKTLLFSKLIYGKYVNTHTSMKENFGNLTTENGVFNLIDVPGHERMRGKYIDKYKPITQALLFIIDSSTIQQDLRDVAEYLYVLLTDPQLYKNIKRLLVVCNKQDLLLAKGSTVVRSMLEKELNALRITQRSQLESVDPKGDRKLFLGKEGEDFSFSSLLGDKVSFVESSFSLEESDSVEVEKWFKSLL